MGASKMVGDKYIKGHLLLIDYIIFYLLHSICSDSLSSTTTSLPLQLLLSLIIPWVMMEGVSLTVEILFETSQRRVVLPAVIELRN